MYITSTLTAKLHKNAMATSLSNQAYKFGWGNLDQTQFTSIQFLNVGAQQQQKKIKCKQNQLKT